MYSKSLKVERYGTVLLSVKVSLVLVTLLVKTTIINGSAESLIITNTLKNDELGESKL